ncbi:MAG: hypothetical protein R6V50_01160 [Thermoplasmatota archaeon]
MKGKIIICSVFVVFILLLTGFSPALASTKDDMIALKTNLVPIQVNYYGQRKPEQVQTMVTIAEAEEIKQTLIALHEAVEKNDHSAILYYENKINEKNIFGERFQQFNIVDNEISRPKRILVDRYGSTLTDDNISNVNCYLNVIGEGAALWGFAYRFYENILRIIRNASSAIEAFVLLIIFLPFLALAILFSSLIPIRIFSPNGTISLKNGTIITRGALGNKRVDVGPDSFNVDVSLFTGISINIPGSEKRNSFLFVSGFAAQVNERE